MDNIIKPYKNVLEAMIAALKLGQEAKTKEEMLYCIEEAKSGLKTIEEGLKYEIVK